MPQLHTKRRFPSPWLSAEALAFVLIPIMIVGLRLPGFFYSAVGLDETLYFLMAHNLLQGHLPYTTTFDNKAPGIYLIFAAALLIFHHGMTAIRIASCIAIACGSLAIYRLIIVATNERRDMALISAYAYVLYTSHFSGLEANTEIFFMPLVACAFALIWPARCLENRAFEPARFAWAGLLLGTAICIKQSAVYDLGTAMIVTALFGSRNHRLRPLGLMFLAALLPPALIPLPYLATGQLQVLYRSTIAANFRRFDLPISLHENVMRFLSQLIFLFPLLELQLLAPAYLWFGRRQSPLSRSLAVASVWFVVESIGALSLGVYESHWVLPLLLPLMIAGAIVLIDGAELLITSLSLRRLTLASVLLSTALIQLAKPLELAATIAWHRLGILPRAPYADRAASVASYLRKRLLPGDYAFIVSPESATEYVLSGARVPTPYGFSYFLTNPYGIRIAGVKIDSEVRKAFLYEPRFVLLQVPKTSDQLEPAFQVLATDPAKVPMTDSTMLVKYVPWLALLKAVELETRSNYAKPFLLDGILVFQRKPVSRRNALQVPDRIKQDGYKQYPLHGIKISEICLRVASKGQVKNDHHR